MSTSALHSCESLYAFVSRNVTFVLASGTQSTILLFAQSLSYRHWKYPFCSICYYLVNTILRTIVILLSYNLLHKVLQTLPNCYNKICWFGICFENLLISVKQISWLFCIIGKIIIMGTNIGVFLILQIIFNASCNAVTYTVCQPFDHISKYRRRKINCKFGEKLVNIWLAALFHFEVWRG